MTSCIQYHFRIHEHSEHIHPRYSKIRSSCLIMSNLKISWCLLVSAIPPLDPPLWTDIVQQHPDCSQDLLSRAVEPWKRWCRWGKPWENRDNSTTEKDFAWGIYGNMIMDHWISLDFTHSASIWTNHEKSAPLDHFSGNAVQLLEIPYKPPAISRELWDALSSVVGNNHCFGAETHWFARVWVKTLVRSCALY